jgi:hypothetical protein
MNKMIEIGHVAGTKNPADMFTKPLAFDRFSSHRDSIHMGDIQTTPKGVVGAFAAICKQMHF